MRDQPPASSTQPGGFYAMGTGLVENVEVVPRRVVPAWLMSFLLHTLVLFLILWSMHRFTRGAAEVDNRTGGIVLVKADNQTTEYLSEGEVEDAEAASEAAAAANPTESELPPDLPGMESLEANVSATGQSLAESLNAADGMLDGTNPLKNIGGKITTEVFGVKGTGSVFVYVFDRSASMEGYEGKPLRAAKQELLKSLDSLGDRHQFQIIFYNDATRIFNPEGRQTDLVFATEAMKARAHRFVQSIRGERGTNHMKALKEALAFGPDVIFLLTDAEGGFTPNELRLIQSWNRAGSVINAIEFGVGTSSGNDRSLQRLAAENGGHYLYKNVLTFRE